MQMSNMIVNLNRSYFCKREVFSCRSVLNEIKARNKTNSRYFEIGSNCPLIVVCEWAASYSVIAVRMIGRYYPIIRFPCRDN